MDYKQVYICFVLLMANIKFIILIKFLQKQDNSKKCIDKIEKMKQIVDDIINFLSKFKEN